MSDQVIALIITGVMLAVLSIPFIWMKAVDDICGDDGFLW